jgi:Acyl-CoA reductase (LuxC)
MANGEWRMAEAELPDFAVPPAWPVEEALAGRGGVAWRAARWTPERLGELAARLTRRGAEALAELGPRRLLDAWGDAVEAWLDPASPERRALGPALATLCRLSPPGLTAGLEAVLGGARREPAERLLAEAQGAARAALSPAERRRPALVILASNLPALAVQPLLPALALGRPALLKSPSAEPLFAPAFAASLARREPLLAEAVAAVTWPGGDRELEAPLLAAAGVVVAYGEEAALADLERRCPGRLVGYGPRTSLALVGPGADPAAVAAGLARDIALFDQRGCLSVGAVYTSGDAGELAAALARALAREAERLPPGPADAPALAAVQQLRAAAEMRGLLQPPLALAAGTVVVEPRGGFSPSPGLRTVRIHPVADLATVPELLAPWRGRLQGAALAGDEARAREPALAALGLSRFAAPGDLQSPDVTWHNGGRHPLAALAGIPADQLPDGGASPR